MRGAYTAKVAEVSSPSVPSGWGDWPFPGPFPPGYVPSLAYGFDSRTEYAPNTTHAMSATLRDGTWQTRQPDGNITWTASIDGVAIQLRFDGDESLQDSLTSSYSGIGDYWGAEPTFVFGVSAADVGKTIALKASGDPFQGYEDIESTHNILVVTALAKYAIFQVVINGPTFPAPAEPYKEYGYGTRLHFHNSAGLYSTPWAYLHGSVYQHDDSAAWTYLHGAYTTDDFGVYVDSGGSHTPPWSSPWVLGTAAVGTLKIKALELDDGITYNVDHRHELTYSDNPGTTTYDYTLQVYIGGALETSKTKQVVKSPGDPLDSLVTWCTIDGTTGDVTEVNP